MAACKFSSASDKRPALSDGARSIKKARRSAVRGPIPGSLASSVTSRSRASGSIGLETRYAEATAHRFHLLGRDLLALSDCLCNSRLYPAFELFNVGVVDPLRV